MVEVDADGALQVPLEEVVDVDGTTDFAVPPTRDISKLNGRVPFLRFGLVDRDRRNQVVFSNYDLDVVLEKMKQFGGARKNIREQAAVVAAMLAGQ